MTGEPVFDSELRRAVFDHVEVLKLAHGDRIPRTELQAGIVFDGNRIPIWNYQKGIFKPAALGPHGAALSIQTSADSPYADKHDADAGYFIYKHRGTDPTHPDNLALRRAGESNLPLLYLVAVDPGFYDAIFPVYVVGENPVALHFVLVADHPSAIDSEQPSTATMYRREYVTRSVMVRLHQTHFRRRVLRAYGERCSICRIGYATLLDAAHILPDKHPQGDPIIPNGIGLCKIHHSAFDAHILGIDPEARVHIRKDVLEEKDGPMLLHGLQELNGTTLTLPRRQIDWPNPEFLSQRFGRFLAT